MPNTNLPKSELLEYSKNFDSAYEDKALDVRQKFIKAFPVKELDKLTLDEYVIGKGLASFCAHVEVKTAAWAVIQGATAKKFGIYYGKTKTDPTKQYRTANKFGKTKTTAFNAVKRELSSLIADGKAMNFQAIDDNLLSQMFKAKILSLYFPETYLNICSGEHIELISSELGLPDDLGFSEYQNLLIKEKLKNPIVSEWSNPKFMSFLYAKFIRKNLTPLVQTKITKPKKKIRRRVNFADLQTGRDAVGKASEEFALAWEIKRLTNLGLVELSKKIKDHRDIPSYGYDFLSYSEKNKERYIEVKSLGYVQKEGCHRFFLSENERSVSTVENEAPNYYFYLVRYGKDGKPQEVIVKHATDVYANSEIVPAAYIVRINIEK
jgi:Domain of unknown function (DUF3883)